MRIFKASLFYPVFYHYFELNLMNKNYLTKTTDYQGRTIPKIGYWLFKDHIYRP